MDVGSAVAASDMERGATLLCLPMGTGAKAVALLPAARRIVTADNEMRMLCRKY
jgi:hypothetical protein